MELRHILLSGGVGSGKSTVGEMMTEMGIRVVSADLLGHEVLQDEAMDDVVARWPEVIVNGAVDRSKLADVVFADSRALTELEAMTHPHIRARIEAIADEAKSAIVVEMHVIEQFLSGRWIRVVVDAPDELRVERLLRRGWSRIEAQKRMMVQPSRLEYLCAADVVIDNSGAEAALQPQVESLVSELRAEECSG